MSTSAVDRIVQAVLYEGYALYPYRPSALKNQRRFAFGAVYPKPWATFAREPYLLRSECVFEVPAVEPASSPASVEIVVRFLVLHRGGGATEESIALAPQPLRTGAWTLREHRAGIPVEVQVDIGSTDATPNCELYRIAVEVSNLAELDPHADRETAMDRTLASTHVIARVRGGTAISSIDPPPQAVDAVASCRTVGSYCVVVATDTILASPIVLADFPEIADESPGDFFDGTEMDEMLTLRVLTMTDAERAEAIASDPRVAALIERTVELGLENTARLHGVTSREGAARVSGAPSAASQRRPSGPSESAPLQVGTRVRLRPAGRADAFDIILAGKLATIVKVERDLEGRVHCAVTIDDDPGKDLGAAGMPGHRFYFRQDELELASEDAREASR